MEIFSKYATEQGSYPFTITFSGVPSSVNWKLTDEDGTVIRATETETPALSIPIMLEGDDLAITGSDDKLVIFTLWGEYDSVTHGTGKPYTSHYGVLIEAMVGIS